MTELDNVVEVSCATCYEEVEVFEDDEEFSCPYCGQMNILVDEAAEEEDLEDEITDSTILVLGRSILATWCSRHKETTEHVWTRHSRTGQKLMCLICWPSKMPKNPIRHVKEEV